MGENYIALAREMRRAGEEYYEELEEMVALLYNSVRAIGTVQRGLGS